MNVKYPYKTNRKNTKILMAFFVFYPLRILGAYFRDQRSFSFRIDPEWGKGTEATEIASARFRLSA